jgi:replicative DNA helicase
MAITELEAQEKLLHLVINRNELIPEFLAEQMGPAYFESKYRPFIYGIEQSHQDSEKFTENYYLDFIARAAANGDYKKWTGSEIESAKFAQQTEKRNFQLITNLDKVDPQDFPLICRKVREYYIKRKSGEFFDRFNTNKNKDYVSAVRDIADDLNILVSSADENNAATWVNVDDYGPDWYDQLEKEALNPKKVLQTGILPFDETMPIGLDPGSLTLIVADVGGFKSATMINISLNVCKQSGENVLYVSLEMPKDRLMQRIISREAEIDSSKLAKPNLLTADEKARVKKAAEDFKQISSKFAILDAQERMTVSKIRAELEKRKHFFKVRLVVIDYISILSPEPWYQKLAEHSWYGQMCKDLRQLGRKMGFAVLSAVQLNREAIKSLRNQKEGKQSVGSDALRGSHDFSADADNIYVQVRHPEQSEEKLYLFCVKSRYGSTMFGPHHNQSKATLDVYPKIGKISAFVDASWADNDPDASEVLRRGESAPSPNPDIDLAFDDEPPKPMITPKEKPKIAKKASQSTDDLGFEL